MSSAASGTSARRTSSEGTAAETVYTDGRPFSNLLVLRFDADGRCSEFVEWFIENPAGA